MPSITSSTNNASAQPPLQARLQSDIDQLQALLSNGELDGDGVENLAELLSRLEDANGVAEGVESRLDDVIGTLDTLLASLEQQEQEGSQKESTTSDSTPQESQ
ncbi:hypothetical protein CONPUDRAFT_161789 [Coniophora puteana RWD-64-598 SS2]|uniref:Uncharacterized protein n=1 Tax=Coniophora puteana (strain RWD-64-598) TaxID=741705 RepID=A0A5M3N7A1_CONPW|nr:uncharacterized protein CONPUDRAFT_161789 [Coniophora puteana RWD-64-598 SS2]EIW87196.1 hypothetical protein CONPUDRAFT_161789 [Coniophora puteana RWD-64-598 SS2]